MIRFHGGPITPLEVAKSVWTAKHACVSFFNPEQTAMAFEIAQSVMLDNGAFSAWSSGKPITDWKDYGEYVNHWRHHPGFAFAILPDVIDGTEQDNNDLIAGWREPFGFAGMVPVWHLHESLDRLRYLMAAWPRVALGSSDQYADIASEAWWARMTEVMGVACNERGQTKVPLHGLRMMNATVISRVPLTSVDSTNLARNHARHRKGVGTSLSPGQAVMIFADRLERHVTAAKWNQEHGAFHFDMELVG